MEYLNVVVLHKATEIQAFNAQTIQKRLTKTIRLMMVMTSMA